MLSVFYHRLCNYCMFLVAMILRHLWMVVRYPCNFSYASTINDNRGLLCAQNCHSLWKSSESYRQHTFAGRIVCFWVLARVYHSSTCPANPDPSTTRHHNTPHIQYVFFFAYTPIRKQKDGRKCCAPGSGTTMVKKRTEKKSVLKALRGAGWLTS